MAATLWWTPVSLGELIYSQNEKETLALLTRARVSLLTKSLDKEPIPLKTVAIKLTIRAFGKKFESSGEGESSLIQCLEKIQNQLEKEKNKDVPENRERWSIVLEWAHQSTPIPTKSTQRFWSSLDPLQEAFCIKTKKQIYFHFPTQWRSWPTSPSKKQIDLIISQIASTNNSIETLLESGEISLSKLSVSTALYDGKKGMPMIGKSEKKFDEEEYATKLIDHIGMSIWPSKQRLGIRGNYDPINNEHLPPIASPSEQALTAFSLILYSKTSNQENSNKSKILADRILNDLIVVEPIEQSPWESSRATAFLLLALCELDESIATSWETEKIKAIAKLVQSSNLSGLDHAIAAAALASSAKKEPHEKVFSLAQKHISKAWEKTKNSQLINLLPWIWFAHKDLEKYPSSIKKIKLFGAMAKGLKEIQITSDPLDSSFGGFLLDINKKSSSQSLRPFAFLLDVPQNLFPNIELKETKKYGKTFFKKLFCDDLSLILSKDQQRTHGGIRSSTWWDRQPAGAQAMALICLHLLLKNTSNY